MVILGCYFDPKMTRFGTPNRVIYHVFIDKYGVFGCTGAQGPYPRIWGCFLDKYVVEGS